MNINKALNEIIFKYHLDKCYPHYENMYRAESILKEMMKDIKSNGRKVIFIMNDKTEKGYIQHLSKDYRDISFLLYERQDMVPCQLEQIVWEEYDKVYLISYYGAVHIERWFRLHHIQYEWIYDIFEREGVFLQKGFLSFGTEDWGSLKTTNENWKDCFKGTLQCELYCQRSKYEHIDDSRTKRIALEKCLFLTLYMRNFIEAEKYISLLIKEDGRYERVWKEIQNLLSTIKKALGNRKSEDIVLYWLDSIPYGGEKNMPYLRHVMDKSIVFENAYTYIPYTKPTLRALFLGKRDIDDGTYDIAEITEENSYVIQFLQEQGYDMKIYSGYFNSMFPPQYQPDRFMNDALLPYSLKLWDIISDMLTMERKGFYVVQTMEVHHPLGCRMGDTDFRRDDIRSELIKPELDEQLAFYDTMLGDDVFRFYMSDHGRLNLYRHHILFNVYQGKLRSKRVAGLFSLLDFGTVLKQLVENGDISEEGIVRECVEIGNCDKYNKEVITKLFRDKEALDVHCFGYKGVIDRNYIYLRFKIGKECLHKREEMEDELLNEPIIFQNCLDDVCEPELLPKYRALTGEYPKHMIEDEKFQYTRYLYKLYDNIVKHMLARVALINQMVKDCPADHIAIRMGGVASSAFWHILSEENRRKIWGFVDNNQKCLCSRLQLPVVGTDEIVNIYNLGVKVIAITSYNYLELVREEALTWPEGMTVLDIYEVFKQNQIECRDNFYIMRGTDEDYEVGFPF